RLGRSEPAQLGIDAQSGFRHGLDPIRLVVGRAARPRPHDVSGRPLSVGPRVRRIRQSEAANAMTELLALDDLRVCFHTRAGDLRAVDGVSYALGEGESLGLVGESGCGKTTIARAILSLLPRNGRVESGRILFRGENLVGLPSERMRALRWRGI